MKTSRNRTEHPLNYRTNRKILVASLFVLTTVNVLSEALEWNQKEIFVKTAYFFNFGRFLYVDEEVTEINFCVLGDNPFGDALSRIDGKEIGEKKASLSKFKQYNDPNAQKCHVAFLGYKSPAKLEQALKFTQKNSILSIVETPDFAELGGAVNFITKGDKVKFQISKKNLPSERIQVSSRLMRIAEVVD